MKLIDRHDIEDWANRYGSKGFLPYVISRLVRSTTPISTSVEFPDGSSTYVGGWDGIVKSQEQTPYVPEGTSLWEFGTQTNVRQKAEDDFSKRSADSLGYNPSDCTLVLVTPRFFADKDAFVQEKLALGIWKDVRVYDSRNIEEWFEIAPVPSRWFSSYLTKYPSDGIITIEEFWEEWSCGPNGELHPTTVTAGREHESRQLLDFLQGAPAIKAIRASSKDEAVAFIIASARQFDKASQGIFEAKALIIDTAANFRSVRINQFGLNLIAKFDDPQVLYAGVAKGHHVLVPLGPDDTFNQDTIILPLIDRDGLIKALESIGLSETTAKNYAKESARNITVLKRLLKFPQNQLEWAKPEYARDIIPAMLVGRWDDRKKGDIELIEKLTGEKYDNYIGKIARWNGHESPPFIKIGDTWRLTSPLDAWTNLAPYITLDDLYGLKQCFIEGYKHGNPVLEPEDISTPFSFLSKEKKFSAWVREGLVQSLVLIGLYGKGIKIPEMDSPQLWVDEVLEELFNEADGEIWVSLNREMPLIAEASPASFFNAVFASLKKEPSPIMEMFREEEGLLTPSSHHTGLLWALEGLAWEPEYFRDATLALSKLAENDPGGNLSNRPINSLTEIFKSWHYQTLASFEERIEVVREIATTAKKTGWVLLLRMLPSQNGIAHPTFKMRWRMFDRSFPDSYTYQEIWDTHTRVVEILISVFDHSENQLSDLLDRIDKLSAKDRELLLEFINSELDNIQQPTYKGWHTLREKLSRHRSHPDSRWALPKSELKKLQLLYDRLEPIEVIPKYKWLFDEHWPAFPEGLLYDNDPLESRHQQQQKIIEGRRIQGLERILDEKGIDSIIALSETVKEPWFLGDTLAKVVKSEETTTAISRLLSSNNHNTLRFAQAFIGRKSINNGLDWGFQLFKELTKKGMDETALSRLLIPMSPSKALWDFLDNTPQKVKTEYWLKVHPNFYHLDNDEKIRGIKELMNHFRFVSAIEECHLIVDNIPSELIVELLEKTATVESKETRRIQGYEVEILFETIEKRGDVDRERLIQLEWLYVSAFASYGNRDSKMLHDELSNSPEFFITILQWAYMPNNEELIKKERKGLSDEVIRNRSLRAYELLGSWKKIPGVNDDGEIDSEYLTNWVAEVRRLAEKADRKEVADNQIGKILAQYPEKSMDWPPDEISEIIESINTNEVKGSFSAATHNKRSFSTRGPFDGGNIERDHADYFRELSKRHKRKHPNISKIFDGLVREYLHEAKRMDEDAERSKLDY